MGILHCTEVLPLLYLMTSCIAIVWSDSVISEEPYVCPYGWTAAARTDDTPDNSHLCLKAYNFLYTYEEAQLKCGDDASYLVNHDLVPIEHILGSDASVAVYGVLSQDKEYWTGLHDDGHGLVWDGVLPSTPRLNILCGNESSIGWWCGDMDQWANPRNGSCVSAKLHTLDGHEYTSAELRLSNCTDRKPAICAGYFGPDTFALIEGSNRCEEGWLWNHYTKLCVKIFADQTAFLSALYLCESVPAPSAGLLQLDLDSDDQKSVMLLKSLFNHSTSTDYRGKSIWTGPWYREIMYSNNGVLYKVEPVGYSKRLPYVCETKEKSAADSAEVLVELSLNTTTSSLTCSMNSIIPSIHAFLTPNGEITNEIVLDFPVSLRQGGDYQCVMYNPENLKYQYSNVLHINDDGRLFYATVQLPLNAQLIDYAPWNSMVEYYPQLNTETNSTYTLLPVLANVTELLDEAFTDTMNQIKDLGYCSACEIFTSVQANMSVLYLTEIRKLKVEDDRILVSAAMVYYTEEKQAGRQLHNTTTEPDDWDFLSAYMRENLINKLSLNSTEAFNLVMLDSQGEQLGVGWNITLPNEDKFSTGMDIEQESTTTNELPAAGPCDEEAVYIDELGIPVNFPAGEEGEEVSLHKCTNSDGPLVTGRCEQKRWQVVSLCDMENVTETTSALLSLSLDTEGTVDSESAISALEKTTEISNTSLNADEVSLVTDILSNSVSAVIENQTVLNEIYSLTFESIDNLLNTDDTTFDKAQSTSNASDRIMRVIEDLIHKPLPTTILDQTGDIFEVAQPNLAFKLSTDERLSGVVSLEEEITSESIVYINNETEEAEERQPLVSISLGNTTDLEGTQRKAFVVYRDEKLHRAADKGLTPGGRVLSATIASIDGTHLHLTNRPGLVTINYPQWQSNNFSNSSTESIVCGYWETEQRTWSTAGCSIDKGNGTGVTCTCNHLTGFSMLVDTRPKPVADIHENIMTIISVIGLITSSVCMACVVLVSLLFRRLRKTSSQKVLIYLSLSILGLNLTFLIGRDMTGNHAGCVVVSMCLHYFLLSVFAWMCVEGVLQYLRFVKVLGTYIPRFMVKASVPAVLLPALIVAATFVTSFILKADFYYSSDHFCWMKTSVLYYAVLLPIGMVLLCNTIIFILVLVGLISARQRMKGHQVYSTNRSTAALHLQASVAVFFILGLTWVFGFLALIKESSLVFQYLFCISNSFQGLMIFIFHNIREPKVQAAWVSIYRKVKVELPESKTNRSQVKSLCKPEEDDLLHTSNGTPRGSSSSGSVSATDDLLPSKA